MLIEIDLGDYAGDASTQLTGDELNALENLAMARREGKHILFGSRACLDLLTRDVSIGEKARLTFERVYNELTTLGQLRAQTGRFVIATGGLAEPALFDKSVTKAIVLPLTFFSDSGAVQETLLLTENHTDTELLVCMAAVHGALVGLDSIPIRYVPQGGGGNTIAQHYQAYQNGNMRLCLCVVDSDRLAPERSIGDTARRAKKVDQNTKPHAELVIMDSRELENLIPISLLREVITSNDCRFPAITMLELMDELNISELRRFIDFKHGSTFGKTLCKVKCKRGREFWSHRVEKLAVMAKDEQMLKCTKACLCAKEKLAPNGEIDVTGCTCQIMRSLGNEILSNVCLHIKRNPRPGGKLRDDLCKIIEREWIALGSIISAWCYGSEIIRGL